MTTTREHILDEAKRCVLRDRNLEYDEPEKNFEDIAAYWNIYLGDKLVEPILPHDTAVMAMLIKVARIQKSPDKEDHWVDLAGYAACGAECIVNKPEPGNEKQSWDWQEFFKDMGGPSHGPCEKVIIKNPDGPDSTMYVYGGVLNSDCRCGQGCDK